MSDPFDNRIWRGRMILTRILSYFHNHQARKDPYGIEAALAERARLRRKGYVRLFKRRAALKGIGKPSGGERRTEEGRTTYAKA